MQPVYSQRGGVRLNGSFITWPFGRIEVFSDHFKILGAKFTHENVTGIRVYRGWLSNGLRVLHSNRNTSEKIIYFPSDFGELCEALEQAGFRVARED